MPHRGTASTPESARSQEDAWNGAAPGGPAFPLTRTSTLGCGQDVSVALSHLLATTWLQQVPERTTDLEDKSGSRPRTAHQGSRKDTPPTHTSHIKETS